MAVSSVSNAPNPTTQALQQQHRNAPPGQTSSLVQALNGTSGQNTQQPSLTQAVQAQTAHAPKPVVNGQGQKTGQVLNTTA